MLLSRHIHSKCRYLCVALAFVMPLISVYHLSIKTGKYLIQNVKESFFNPSALTSATPESKLAAKPTLPVAVMQEKWQITFVHQGHSDQFNPIELCAVSTATRHHPHWNISVYTKIAKMPPEWTTFSNIKLNQLDYTSMFKSTALHGWFMSNETKRLVKNETLAYSVAASTDSDDGNSLTLSVYFAATQNDQVPLSLMSGYAKRMRTCSHKDVKCYSDKYISELLDHGEKSKDRSVLVLPLVYFHALQEIWDDREEALFSGNGVHMLKEIVQNEDVIALHLGIETLVPPGKLLRNIENSSILDLVCNKHYNVDKILTNIY